PPISCSQLLGPESPIPDSPSSSNPFPSPTRRQTLSQPGLRTLASHPLLPHNKHNQQNDQQQPQPAARVIPPPRAVRPGRQRPDEQQHQQHRQEELYRAIHTGTPYTCPTPTQP